MYVFVEIRFDHSHLVATIRKAFKPETRLALMGTIQFTGVLGAVHQQLLEQYPNVFIPQAKPLSAGETLGCTSPLLPDCDALVFLADGRFHLESAMIRNPKVPAYRYDPYSKIMTSEAYDVDRMKETRMKAIQTAKSAEVYGLIMGTLGRQGSSAIFKRLRQLITSHGKKVVPFLMAEINRAKLELITEVDVWVQVACPRLSIDWGAESGFDKPILTPYELEVSLNEAVWSEVYPMDFYSNDGGTWGNMHHRLIQVQHRAPSRAAAPPSTSGEVTIDTSIPSTAVTDTSNRTKTDPSACSSSAISKPVVLGDQQCCGGDRQNEQSCCRN
jgi:2-(3-amino-3-carboxypropyl)histidine synthase